MLAHYRSDDFRSNDAEVAQPRLAHGGDDGIRFLAEIAGGLRAGAPDANQHVAIGRIAVLLHDRVAAGGQLRECRAHAFERRVLIELQDDDRSAGEIDAKLQAGPVDVERPGQDDDQRQRDRMPAPADEVVVRVLEDLHDV